LLPASPPPLLRASHARKDHPDLLARLDPRESPERLELPDDPALMLPLAPPDLVVPPGQLENPARKGLPANRVSQHSPKLSPLESQENKEKPDPLDPLARQDLQEPTDPQDHLDRKDPQDQMDRLEQMEARDHKEPLDHKDPLERKVSAPNTVPSTEVSSSRTEPDVKRYQQKNGSLTSAIARITVSIAKKVLLLLHRGHGSALAMFSKLPSAYVNYLGPQSNLLLSPLFLYIYIPFSPSA
jgi:hypothetical protein